MYQDATLDRPCVTHTYGCGQHDMHQRSALVHAGHQQPGTCVMPREPEVAAGSRGESPCWAGSPLGDTLPGGGSPLAVPFELVRKARCWRRVTSSAAIAAAPSRSCRCSAYRYSIQVKDSGSMHIYPSCRCSTYRYSNQVKDSGSMHIYPQLPLLSLQVKQTSQRQ